MELFWVVISAFGGTSAMLALAWFLFGKFVDIQVAKAVEGYKAELDQKSAVLKTELSIYAHEQNVGLSRIDEQRSQAIQAIYGLVSKWSELLMEIAKPNESKFPSEEMKLRRYHNLSTSFVKAAEELSVKVRDAAIFFQQESYEVIARFGLEAMNLSCDFYDATFGKVDMSKEPDYAEVFSLIETERTRYRGDAINNARELQRLLVHEFRVLMKAERQLTSGSRSDAPKSARA